jgi:hypothetical protein
MECRGGLKCFEPVLKEWIKLVEDPTWEPKTDGFPWHYNERAMLSLLVGAVWRVHGWAFEEYRTRKASPDQGEGLGRNDAMLEFNQRQFLAEAKHVFLPASTPGRIASHAFAGALEAARGDAERMSLHRGYQRIAIVTAAPVITEDFVSRQDESIEDSAEKSLRHVRTTIDGRHTAIAWAFPARARQAPLPGRGKIPSRYLPGVIIAIDLCD